VAQAGLPLESGSHEHPPTTFVTRPRPQLLASRRDVEAVTRGTAEACLLNALSPAGFRGEDRGSAARSGRIPGSINVHWQSLLDPDSGCFQSLAAMETTLRREGMLDAPEVIAYCGGGIAATVALFALSRLDRGDARLYDGSLGEWSRDASLPLETGPATAPPPWALHSDREPGRP
jgi:thiosulfate/3-mercaptopyruvate sulfurtransferase